MKGGKSSDKETLNCLKPYWLTIVVMNARRLSCRAPSIITQSITRIFMRRLFTLSAVFQSPHIILYDWKMIFYKIFSNFLIHGGTETISSIYVKAFKSERFRLGLTSSATRLLLLYIYLVINKYITSQALVILARKILKKIWKSREIRPFWAV